MNRLIATVIFLFMAVMSIGQDISRHEADSLTRSLAASKSATDHIEAFFRLAQFHMFKPGEFQQDLDSATNCIEQAAILNTKLKSSENEGFLILLKSFLAREKGQMKEGKAMAENAVAILKKGKNPYFLGKAYFALSDYYDYGKPNENAEKISLVELASTSFRQAGNIERQAFTFTFLADLYSINHDRTKAFGKIDTALALYKSINHTRLQSVYILYSNLYYDDGNQKQALNYALMALKTAESAGDSSMSLCQINNYIGLILKQLKEPAKSINYYLAALTTAKNHSDNNAVLQVLFNAVLCYLEIKRPDEALVLMKSVPQKLLVPKSEASYIMEPFCYIFIYMEQKRYDLVQSYFNRMLEIIKTHKPEGNMLYNVYFMLTRFYLQIDQAASAGKYLIFADSVLANLGGATRYKENFLMHFRVDTAFHNYKSAVTNLLKYQNLNDSIFNETSNKQIRQLEIEYETEKHKNEIALLGQQNQLAQSRLEHEKLVKNFIIAGIALLFIIMVLLYRQYMLKRQSNMAILHKNKQLQDLVTEKEWLVKEIHHRVKNNFHIVASLLEIQSSYLKNKEALSAIKESQNRIHSMSIIHQKLYQSETLSTIHMPEYIYELVEHLQESYAIRENIGFSLQIENIELNHASAITLGLILNEAITNSIKYAFSETQDGIITISLSHISDSQLLLSITDNGRGLPADFDTKIGASMGMELLQGLTADLGGSFSIETKNGTHIKIIFDYTPIRPGSLLSA